MEIGLAGLLAALFVLAFAWEPRAMRCAVLLLGAVSALLLRFVGLLVTAFAEQSSLAGAWVLLAVMVLIALMLATVAIMLVASGLAMLRREGRRPANLLSLLLGVLLLAGLVAGSLVLAANSLRVWSLAFLASLPVAFLAFGFVAYLIYSPLYIATAARRHRDVVAVVVLGSGLIDGAVPPLLAGRLDRARGVYDSAVAIGAEPVLVTSGGKGADEPRSEAAAMADYLYDRGVPPAAVVVEGESRNTEENIRNTAAMLDARGLRGPVAVVTSDYHAFRAATLMRRAGVRGYVLGARTADYYWPNASIREYVAILRDHLWFVVVSLVLLLLPLAAYLAFAGG